MRKITVAVVLAFVIALMLSCAASLCHGAVQQYKPNSLGVLIPTMNPNTAIVGQIVGGEQHVDKDGRVGINVRIHPVATYRLFDTSVMFCGDVTDKLTIRDGDKHYFFMGYYVLIYKRVSARLIDGVPCHDLLDVDKVLLPPGTEPLPPKN